MLVSLESGDHLTREEFHRRYLERPDIKKAELVEGVVYVGGRVRALEHGMPHGTAVGWLGTYAARIPNLSVAVGSTVFLDARNEVQPDALLLYKGADGPPYVTDDGYLKGPPQLIVEIAASSVSYDLHEKKEAYRRTGVGTYIVWRVLDRAVDWFDLQDGQYVARGPDQHGILESGQFPGLRLHLPSLLAGNAAGVLAALDPAWTPSTGPAEG
jgi:Uma2 family endonuclease